MLWFTQLEIAVTCDSNDSKKVGLPYAAYLVHVLFKDFPNFPSFFLDWRHTG